MAHAVCGSGELVRNGRIDVRVVRVRVVCRLRNQSVSLHRRPAQQHSQELVVSDVLHHSADDPATLLE